MSEYSTIMEVLKRYNEGSIDLSDDDAELLAMQAKRLGVGEGYWSWEKDAFNVESKPLRKGAFDLADMATFGMLPNEWRPRSPGQDLYGENFSDKLAGGVGSLVGLGAGGAGAVKGSKVAWDAIKKRFARKRAEDIATSIYKGTTQSAASAPLRLGPGAPRLNAPPKLLSDPRRPGSSIEKMLENMRRNEYLPQGFQFGGGVGFQAPAIETGTIVSFPKEEEEEGDDLFSKIVSAGEKGAAYKASKKLQAGGYIEPDSQIAQQYRQNRMANKRREGSQLAGQQLQSNRNRFGYR
jgi:hypothetical protein